MNTTRVTYINSLFKNPCHPLRIGQFRHISVTNQSTSAKWQVLVGVKEPGKHTEKWPGKKTNRPHDMKVLSCPESCHGSKLLTDAINTWFSFKSLCRPWTFIQCKLQPTTWWLCLTCNLGIVFAVWTLVCNSALAYRLWTSPDKNTQWKDWQHLSDTLVKSAKWDQYAHFQLGRDGGHACHNLSGLNFPKFKERESIRSGASALRSSKLFEGGILESAQRPRWRKIPTNLNKKRNKPLRRR